MVAARSAGQLSQTSATRSPMMDLGEHRSPGTKNRTKIFSGGSSDTTGAPAAMVSPGRARTSATLPADRRGHVALVEAPFGHVDGGARRLDGRVLRLDLPLAADRRVRLRQRRLEAATLALRGAQVGPLLIQRLWC